MSETWSGVIDGLQIEGDGTAEARYALRLKDQPPVTLNERLGQGLRLVFHGVVVCAHCGSEGRQSFGGGYCWACFNRLARCDLCVLSPSRCHHHLGTCREPAWGESFCMQPHRVYLANSSGIKVGITRRGRERSRWLDQGAIQGLVILNAATRRAAGLAEAMIAGIFPERTDWRKMLRPDVPELDLVAAAALLPEKLPELPEGISEAQGERVNSLRYPLPATATVTHSLKLRPGMPLAGNLNGMKGQYLLLGSGALNLRHCVGFRVTLEAGEPFTGEIPGEAGGGEQLGLF